MRYKYGHKWVRSDKSWGRPLFLEDQGLVHVSGVDRRAIDHRPREIGIFMMEKSMERPEVVAVGAWTTYR